MNKAKSMNFSNNEQDLGSLPFSRLLQIKLNLQRGIYRNIRQGLRVMESAARLEMDQAQPLDKLYGDYKLRFDE